MLVGVCLPKLFFLWLLMGISLRLSRFHLFSERRSSLVSLALSSVCPTAKTVIVLPFRYSASTGKNVEGDSYLWVSPVFQIDLQGRFCQDDVHGRGNPLWNRWIFQAQRCCRTLYQQQRPQDSAWCLQPLDLIQRSGDPSVSRMDNWRELVLSGWDFWQEGDRYGQHRRLGLTVTHDTYHNESNIFAIFFLLSYASLFFIDGWKGPFGSLLKRCIGLTVVQRSSRRLIVIVMCVGC